MMEGSNLRTSSSTDEMLSRLEIIAQLRPQAEQLDNIKKELLNAMELHGNEFEAHKQYVGEMKILKQELSDHRDAISAIKEDIKKLEDISKISDGECERLTSHIKNLCEDYQKVKVDVDESRAALGLTPIEDIGVDKIFSEQTFPQ